ncbi:unnamed protein product [Durusdinium trenchii]|uniref:Uncharacterized protein n=1 Tax=Durusdinium trenchii TaxID=1381693 RepID=A0ABP0QFA8_9DINO
MIGADLLHIWHLGVGRDALGSILRILIKEHYWPGSNIDKRLSYASACLKGWCKQKKLPLAIKGLTQQNLNWGSEYPELRCKGSDTRCVLEWLNDELQRRPCRDSDVSTVAWM